MRYSIETTEDDLGFVETLAVNGKEYKKTYDYAGLGRYECQDNDFCEQLENDGFEDEEFLEIVQDQIDSINLGFDLLCISRLV